MFGTIVEVNLAQNAWSKSQISFQPDFSGPVAVLTISKGTVILRESVSDSRGSEITPEDLRVGDRINVAMSLNGNEAALIKVTPSEQYSLSERQEIDAELHLRAIDRSRRERLPYAQALQLVLRENTRLAQRHSALR